MRWSSVWLTRFARISICFQYDPLSGRGQRNQLAWPAMTHRTPEKAPSETASPDHTAPENTASISPAADQPMNLFDCIRANLAASPPRSPPRYPLRLRLVGFTSGFSPESQSNTQSEDSLGGRLADFGFRIDEVITWLGRAPFGDPYFFLVRGATIALRETELKRFKVVVLSR